MYINLHRTVEKLGQNLPRDGRITSGMLEKAYELTLRLRSQLLGAMYDRIDFGSVPKRIIGEVSASQTDSVVCAATASASQWHPPARSSASRK